ncbi:ABC transporter permease, partial [Candidatus Sumerlaeota bacterium]|nr:ABC transporter permease [Candidatus Sumerlaeota bacterium]
SMVFSVYLTRKTQEAPRPARTVAVADLSKQLSEQIERVFDQHNKFNPQRQIVLKQVVADESTTDSQTQEARAQVQDGSLDAYLLVAKDAVEGQGKSYYYAKARNIGDFDMFSTVQRLLNDAVVAERFRRHNLPAQLIAELRRWVAVEQVDVGAKVQKKVAMEARMMAPFFFLFLMFMGIFSMGSQILSSVIEEKGTRVIEVLLASLNPIELMAGKILGLAAAGLVVVAVWGSAAYGTITYRGMTDVVSIAALSYFLPYFVLGFLLTTAVFAAIGSACNTIKESQSMMFPVTLVFIIPMLSWFFIAQHPESPVSVILSFIPPFTPMIMVLRIAAYPEIPLIQIVASLVILAASVPAIMWAAGKIFRTGVLMYGKPPSPRELWRWLRCP